MESENKLTNSRYCKEIRWIVNNQEETLGYLRKDNNLSRKDVIKIARYRMGMKLEKTDIGKRKKTEAAGCAKKLRRQ